LLSHPSTFSWFISDSLLASIASLQAIVAYNPHFN